MTYKGIDIGRKPKFDQLREYIKQENLCFDAMDVYHYWEPKFWSTKNGVRVKSLERAVEVVNKNIQRLKDCDKKGKKQKTKKASPQLSLPSKTKPKKYKSTPAPKKFQKDSWMPYEEQLQDNRWKAFRTFIFAVRGKKCERCGAVNNLQVHHPKYIYGRMAWEYTCKEVQVLCEKCHAAVHGKTVSE